MATAVIQAREDSGSEQSGLESDEKRLRALQSIMTRCDQNAFAGMALDKWPSATGPDGQPLRGLC